MYDTLAHASFKEGLRLGHARRFAFKHNDLNDLERILKKVRQENNNATSQSQIFIYAEAAYSMDGDLAPLPELVSLSKKYDAHLIIDEAHSTGLVGNHGAGLVADLGLQDKIFARVMTFGKGPGVQGACIAGSQLLKDTLINFALPFIYTTAPPPHTFIAVQESFKMIAEQPEERQKLQANSQLFDKLMADQPDQPENGAGKQTSYLPKESFRSPIKIWPVAGNEQALNAAAFLQQSGFEVRAILSPTVKSGAERLRICLHSFNTSAEIQKLIGFKKYLRGQQTLAH